MTTPTVMNQAIRQALELLTGQPDVAGAKSVLEEALRTPSHDPAFGAAVERIQQRSRPAGAGRVWKDDGTFGEVVDLSGAESIEDEEDARRRGLR